MSRNSIYAAISLVAAGAFLGWLTFHFLGDPQVVAQEKTPAKASPEKLDRTVLPIPEPKIPHSTVLDARNAKARRGSR